MKNLAVLEFIERPS